MRLPSKKRPDTRGVGHVTSVSRAIQGRSSTRRATLSAPKANGDDCNYMRGAPAHALGHAAKCRLGVRIDRRESPHVRDQAKRASAPQQNIRKTPSHLHMAARRTEKCSERRPVARRQSTTPFSAWVALNRPGCARKPSASGPGAQLAVHRACARRRQAVAPQLASARPPPPARNHDTTSWRTVPTNSAYSRRALSA